MSTNIYFYFSSWSSVASSRERSQLKYRHYADQPECMVSQSLQAHHLLATTVCTYTTHLAGRSGGHFLCVTFGTEQLQPVPVRGERSANSPYKVGSSLWYRWHVFGVTIGWTIAEASLSYNGSSYQGCIPAGRTHLAREDIRIYGCSPNWTAAPQFECMLRILWGSACIFP